MYKIDDFSVITKVRGDERFGQTDVGGIYAYLMLQCFELTGEDRFIEEARKAIDKAKGLRFDLLYQANLSAWGAVACLRLWRITQEADYLAQSYAYPAGFFHNATIWQSRLGTAQHFDHFMGVLCLHDAPYMAMYECFESFAGFEEYLAQAGAELDPAARMLISEFCRYTLHRAWFYYPQHLPDDAIHHGEHQSGVINPKLTFPLEDLYPDGQQAGQVGQENYGSGGAFTFASRSLHRSRALPSASIATISSAPRADGAPCAEPLPRGRGDLQGTAQLRSPFAQEAAGDLDPDRRWRSHPAARVQ